MAGESISALFLKWARIFAIGRHPKWTLIRLGVLVSLAIVVPKFVLVPVRVTGVSMLPTYLNGDVNFINRLAYRSALPRRGDVVGIRMAGDHAMLLKRVVGLPGETVSFAHGHVCINGVPLEEPYLKLHSDWGGEVTKTNLQPAQYYFVGDNRSMPADYHEKGVTDFSRIVGRVLLAGRQKPEIRTP